MLDVRKRTGYLFLAVVMGHIILISWQVQSKSGVRVLEAVAFGAFARVQAGVARTVNAVTGFWGNYVALRGARTENEALRRQVAELQVRLIEERALASRAAKLQELLDLRSTLTLPTIAAEVIAGNPTPGMRTITVNRGSRDGVQPDMAVIAASGVVGRVVGPLAAHASRVQLVIDHNAALGALTERTRAGGMVVGVEEDPPLRMELVSNLSDVKLNDVVVTSGVDGIYSKGLPIGRVESVERGPGLYLTIRLRPFVDASSLEEVLVVLVPARPATAEDPGGAGAAK